MRIDNVLDMSGDTRTRSPGVSDPWGRGVNHSPGRGGGSLTPRLRYSSRIRGRHKTPADGDSE